MDSTVPLVRGERPVLSRPTEEGPGSAGEGSSMSHPGTPRRRSQNQMKKGGSEKVAFPRWQEQHKPE